MHNERRRSETSQQKAARSGSVAQRARERRMHGIAPRVAADLHPLLGPSTTNARISAGDRPITGERKKANDDQQADGQ